MRGRAASVVLLVAVLTACASSATTDPPASSPGTTAPVTNTPATTPSLDHKQQQCRQIQASLREQAAINADATGDPTVAIIGDSYVVGRGGTDARHGWAYLLARQEGWRGILLGIGGTGLKNDGPCNGQTYLRRVDQAAAADPDAVLVEGGLNDRSTSAAEEETLLRQLIAALRAAIPGVEIALVGPPAPGPEYEDGVAKISSAFRSAAAATGVRFVDPYAERWFTPANRTYLIAPDGIHPNNAGHAYFAQRVAADLHDWP